MEQRISVVTLGVADLDLSRRFYEQGLGWRRGNADEGIAFYQLNGCVLALFSRDALAEDVGVSPGGSGFRGLTLAYNARSRQEVDTVVEEARRAGAPVLKDPQETFWGGYSGYFADPDGHLWEIAWNPGWTLTPDGAVKLSQQP